MRTKSFCISLLLSSSLLAHVIQANAQTYTFTDLGTLGGSNTTATAINDAGQIVGHGWTTGGDAASHAILWNGSTATDLTPGIPGFSSLANDINNIGQVAGNSVVNWSTGWAWRASVWNGTTLTVLGTLPDTTHTSANGINNSGQVAGSTIVGSFSGEYHATVWNGTTPTDLGIGIAYSINDAGQVAGSSGSGYGYATVWNGTTPTVLGLLPGVTASNAVAINNSGEVIGWSLANNEYHATLWNNTVATDFGTSAGLLAINNMGTIVGSFNGHAALWNGSTVLDLNTFLDASAVSAGWVMNFANGINDNGWIIGGATNTKTGTTHEFLLSVAAVPEPETYAMMLAGLGLIGFTARRKSASKRSS